MIQYVDLDVNKKELYNFFYNRSIEVIDTAFSDGATKPKLFHTILGLPLTLR